MKGSTVLKSDKVLLALLIVFIGGAFVIPAVNTLAWRAAATADCRAEIQLSTARQCEHRYRSETAVAACYRLKVESNLREYCN